MGLVFSLGELVKAIIRVAAEAIFKGENGFVIVKQGALLGYYVCSSPIV